MIYRIGKNTDICFYIYITDSNHFPIRVKDADELTFTFFTTCDCNIEGTESAITASYKDGILTNIVVGKDIDQTILPQDQLNKLARGVLRYKYNYRVKNDKFPDGYYDEENKGTTNVVLI